MASAREAARSLTSASLLPAKRVETLAATRTITPDEVRKFNFFSFDPGGAARNVDLPPEGQSTGVFLFIANEADAAEIMTIRDDAGATVVSPTQGEAAVVWCDGVSWFGLISARSPVAKAAVLPALVVETLAANRTITAAEIAKYNAFAFDPGGVARNVDLPAEATSVGAFVLIANTADAAEVLTIRNDALATIATPTQAEAVMLWCDGVSWFGLVGASS